MRLASAARFASRASPAILASRMDDARAVSAQKQRQSDNDLSFPMTIMLEDFLSSYNRRIVAGRFAGV